MKEIVKRGGACRFCERIFINERGKCVSYGGPAVCQECNSFVDGGIAGFIKARGGTLPEKVRWEDQAQALLKLIKLELQKASAAPEKGDIKTDEPGSIS